MDITSVSTPPNNFPVLGVRNFSETLAASGNGQWWKPPCFGDFSLAVSGVWVGSWKLQRTFDGGTTPLDYTTYDQPFSETTNMALDMSQSDQNCLWRLVFTRTSGSLTYRWGQ